MKESKSGDVTLKVGSIHDAMSIPRNATKSVHVKVPRSKLDITDHSSIDTASNLSINSKMMS